MDFRFILVLFLGIVVTRCGASSVSSMLDENEDAQEAEDSASVSSYKYKWTENGKKREEDITIDKKKGTEKIHVNADEESDAADIFHDFPGNTTVYRVPKLKVCFVGPLDPFAQSPSELIRNLEKSRKENKKPSDEITTQVKTTYRDDGSLESTASLSDDVRKLCEGFSIEKIEKGRNVASSGQHGKAKRGCWYVRIRIRQYYRRCSYFYCWIRYRYVYIYYRRCYG